MRILKYELEITDIQVIRVEGDVPQILSVAEQNGKLMMWAFVRENSSLKSTITINIVGTGNKTDDYLLSKYNFIGTVLMRNSFVWHVFAVVSYVEQPLQEGLKEGLQGGLMSAT